MVTGKTRSGFSFCVKKRAMNNMELVDALAEMQGENPLAVSKVVRMVLGEDQRRRLYDHVRDEEGYVDAQAVSQEIMEVFEAFGSSGKNS